MPQCGLENRIELNGFAQPNSFFSFVAHFHFFAHGDVWFAVARSPDELASALNELRYACDALGRDFSEIEVTWFWDRHFDRDAVQSLADMGVHRLLVPMLSLGRDPLEGMEKFAAKMMQ